MLFSANPVCRPVVLGLVGVVLTLCGCSDYYYDRRDTVAFHAGDAAASNKAAQMIDPWPAEAGDRSIEANGERMQRAAERYRTNKTTPLATSNTSAIYQAVPVMTAPSTGGSSN